MKVIMNIDNDSIVAFAVLIGIKGKDRETLKQFLSNKEEVEVDTSILGEEAEAQMNLLGTSLVLAAIGKDENN